MKIQSIDSKRRLILPGAEPGESYAVRQTANGHYELAKVIPSPKAKTSSEELDALLVTAALTPRTSWEALRALTREP